MTTIFKISCFLFFITPTLVFSFTNQKVDDLNSLKRRILSIKQQDVSDDLRVFLKKTHPGRMVGTLGHKKAVDHISAFINNLDSKGKNKLFYDSFSPDIDKAIEFYKNDFKNQIKNDLAKSSPAYIRWETFTKSVVKSLDQLREVKGKNIIWEKKGNEFPNEVLIIGAHYDSIAFDQNTMQVKLDNSSPGADDNASGVIVALNMIKLLSNIDIKRTVRIIFFDFQEFGFIGSNAYITHFSEQLKKEKVIGYMNVEMVGHDSSGLDKSKKTGNMKAYIRSPGAKGYNKDLSLAEEFISSGKKMSSQVKFEIDPNGFNMSDHVNFWKQGIAAVAFSQNWEEDFNPRHHSSNDFFETLNIKTIFHSFQFLSGSVISWALKL